jgi:hypothetical protein
MCFLCDVNTSRRLPMGLFKTKRTEKFSFMFFSVIGAVAGVLFAIAPAFEMFIYQGRPWAALLMFVVYSIFLVYPLLAIGLLIGMFFDSILCGICDLLFVNE